MTPQEIHPARPTSAVPPNRRVLVIDDRESIHDDFRKVLGGGKANDELDMIKALVLGGGGPAPPGGNGFDLDFALQGQQGADLVRKACEQGTRYAMAFVDMRMPPGWDGLETIEHLWEIDPDIQIVICSAYSDYSHKEIQGRLGYSDQVLVLRKPFDVIEVSQLACALTKKWELLQGAKSQHDLLERVVAERTAELRRVNNESRLVNKSLREALEKQRELEVQLRHDTLHDALTGLANRTLLADHLDRCIERSKRQKNYFFAVLFLDLDNFKVINDSLGHAQGDRLLVRVAQRLRNSIRLLDTAFRPASDTIGRIGGDEFVIVLDGMTRASDAPLVAERILEDLGKNISLGKEMYAVSCSVGIATNEAEYEQPDEVLRDADTALQEAKGSGKNSYRIFDQPMREKVLARLRVDNNLRWAIGRDELSLQYQPIVSLETGDIVAFEALLRWNRAEYGPVAPDEFIPIAEEAGLIGMIGEWVLENACRQLAAWHAIRPELRINVNVSPCQLMDRGFTARMNAIVKQVGILPSDLNLELTETAMMENHAVIKEMVVGLRDTGAQIHLDDFGTGYSSFSYLDMFTIDVLKIDQSFVKKLGRDRQAAVSLQSIIQLAELRGYRVTAEGVETHDAMVQLQSLACNYAQGYFFSRPLDPDIATDMLKKCPGWLNKAA